MALWSCHVKIFIAEMIGHIGFASTKILYSNYLTSEYILKTECKEIGNFIY